MNQSFKVSFVLEGEEKSFTLLNLSRVPNLEERIIIDKTTYFVIDVTTIPMDSIEVFLVTITPANETNDQAFDPELYDQIKYTPIHHQQEFKYTLKQAVNAIEARIKGDWDNPQLKKLKKLRGFSSIPNDVERIINLIRPS